MWRRVVWAAGVVLGLVMMAAAATAALAGTPGTLAGNGAYVGGVTFSGPEPLVLWTLPGSGGRLGTCIDANVNGPLTGPYQFQDSIDDPVYAELNHLYANAATSDVQLAELSALNSARFDLVDKSAQWGYVTRGQGGLSVADANAMLARARALAGPYTVTVSWPSGDTAVDTDYQATIAVHAASGAPVPGAAVSVIGSKVLLATSKVTTDATGQATVGFRIPVGTSSTIAIGANVPEWTTVDRLHSQGEQTMLVTGAPSNAHGVHTAPVTRTRDVRLIKIKAGDKTRTPVAGYIFKVIAADGTVVNASLTSQATPVDLGELPIGATYRVTEVGAPSGGSLYIPANATTTFTVPAGSGEWIVAVADPARPVPSLRTQVTSERAMPGQRLADRVTVAGDDGEDGVITAQLYGPVPAPGSGRCSDLDAAAYRAAPSQTYTASIDGTRSGGNGTLDIRGPVVTRPGCYGWSETLVLSPSGVTATSPPTAPHESSLVTAPMVSTTASSQVATPGTRLHDTVVVTGLSSGAGLTATLYGPLPANGASGCHYDAAAWREATKHAGAALVAGRAHITINGDGTYDVGAVTVTKAGCYTYVETLAPMVAGVAPVHTSPGQTAESTIVVAPRIGTVATPSTGVPGGLLRDVIRVRGLGGLPATITGRLLGPVASRGGSCAHLDWAYAKVASVITPIKVRGDGRFITVGTRVAKAGCYTFVETLTTPTLPHPVASTHPGERAETVLVTTSTAPLAATGVPVDGWLLGGVSLLGMGAVAFTLGSLRRGSGPRSLA